MPAAWPGLIAIGWSPPTPSSTGWSSVKALSLPSGIWKERLRTSIDGFWCPEGCLNAPESTGLSSHSLE